MSEFKNKNDYSCVVFPDRQNEHFKPFKMEFVHNCYAFSQWLTNSREFNSWVSFNVYNRRTRKYIRQMKNGDFIEAKPK